MVVFLHSIGSFLLIVDSSAVLDKIIMCIVVVATSELKRRLLSVSVGKQD